MTESSVASASAGTGRNGEHVHGLLIDGELRPGGGEILELINPATATVFARCHSASAEDTHDAVASARTAFELARAWDLPRRDVLRGFLHATRAGLVDLNWQINCPVCRVSANVVDSLAEVGRDVHCESCNIRYSVAFGDDVEAVFRCNAALRPVQPSVYCASSPTFRPHVLAQLRVDPGKSRTESIDLGCRHVRVRTLAKHKPGLFDGARPPARLEVRIDDEAVTVESEGHAEDGAATEVVLSSTASDSVYVLLERAGWSADAVLGSVIASIDSTGTVRNPIPGSLYACTCPVVPDCNA